MIETLPSRQKILSEVALHIAMADNFRDRSGEVIKMVAPYCDSDIIITYRPEDDDNFHIVSSWGNVSKESYKPYSIFDISPQILSTIDNNEIITEKMATEIGLSLPCLIDPELASALIFSFKVEGSIQGFLIFISHKHSIWTEDTIEWISTIVALIKGSIHRTMANERLAAQLAWRDKIYPIIAHDLRSSIGTIRMLLDATYDTHDEQERSEMLEMAKSNATEAFILLDNLLKWSRQHVSHNIEIRMEKVNFLEQIKSVYTYFSPIAKIKGIELVDDMPDKDFETKIDVEMILTVVRNLVSNAIKFTPRGGKVTLGVRIDQASIHVWIEDNGVGLNPQQLEKINSGTQYFSRHGTGGEKGSGLGLTLVREFLALHGGQLSIRSATCVGSHFSFDIPQLS